MEKGGGSVGNNVSITIDVEALLGQKQARSSRDYA